MKCLFLNFPWNWHGPVPNSRENFKEQVLGILSVMVPKAGFHPICKLLTITIICYYFSRTPLFP